MPAAWIFDTGPEQGTFVYSHDPAVVAANSADALEVYRRTGDLAALVVPPDATRFHLRPVAPGSMASAHRPPIAGVRPSAALHGLRAAQAGEDAALAFVSLGLVRVDGWPVPGPDGYGPMLRWLQSTRPAVAYGLIAELSARVVALSRLTPHDRAAVVVALAVIARRVRWGCHECEGDPELWRSRGRCGADPLARPVSVGEVAPVQADFDVDCTVCPLALAREPWASAVVDLYFRGEALPMPPLTEMRPALGEAVIVVKRTVDHIRAEEAEQAKRTAETRARLAAMHGRRR